MPTACRAIANLGDNVAMAQPELIDFATIRQAIGETFEHRRGSQLQFGVAYYFSKRTYLFAMAALLRNGYSAQYNNSLEQTPAVGEDLDQYAIGINHSF